MIGLRDVFAAFCKVFGRAAPVQKRGRDLGLAGPRRLVWTNEMIASLFDWVRAGRSLPEWCVANRCSAHVATVYCRREGLFVQGTISSGKHYTSEEDRVIRTGCAEGKSTAEIALQLPHRTANSISNRCFRLRQKAISKPREKRHDEQSRSDGSPRR